MTLLGTLAGCASIDAQRTPMKAQHSAFANAQSTARLTGNELAKVIIGSVVQIDAERAGIITSPHAVVYLENGSAAIEGDRGRLTGRYAIERDAVCITVHGSDEQCFAFYMDSSGGYLMGNESQTLSDLVPVLIASLGEGN